jgi:hypothetical protein
MPQNDQELYQHALRKTTQWQLLMLLALGGFLLLLVLLFVIEVFFTHYWEIGTILLGGVLGLGLIWAAYFWSHLLRSILATRRYLATNEEAQLLKAYQQQRLFWQNIGIMTGLFLTFVVGLFLFLLASFGIR